MQQNDQTGKQKTNNPYLIVWIIVITLLNVIPFLIGPVITFFISLKFRKSRLAFYLIRIMVVLFIVQCGLLARAIPNFFKARTKAWESVTKSNICSIEIALERYAIDNGTYPQYISKLFSDGYMEEIPTNPFSNSPMKPINFGDSDFEGNFTYLPIVIDSASGFTPHYYLIGYGSRENPGQDVNKDGIPDNVIYVCAESCALEHHYQRYMVRSENGGLVTYEHPKNDYDNVYERLYFSCPSKSPPLESLLNKPHSETKRNVDE